MYVIRHAVDCDQLLALVRDDAGYVFVEVLFEFRSNYGKAVLNGKDSLNVDLGVVFAISLTFRSSRSLRDEKAGVL
jgi:hypothetical protein